MTEPPLIWVATSHDDARQLLVQLIAAKGYEVMACECGPEVLKHARFRKPSLVIIDCGLPDSFETLSALRVDAPTLREVPVLMFSTDDQRLHDKALAAGATAYVPKGSLDWAEMLSEIERLVGGA